MRIDIKKPLEQNPRLPNGKEMGANDHFVWGGYTSGGAPELVINQVPNTDAARTVTFIDDIF